MFIGVVATTPTGLIGKGNGLPWHIPLDSAFFRRIITDKAVLVGKNTWNNLPKLPFKKVYIYSSSGEDIQNDNGTPITLVKTPTELAQLAAANEDVYVIGGAYLYSITYSICDYFIMTMIYNNNYIGHSYFPIEKFKQNFDLVRASLEKDETTGDKLEFQFYMNKRRNK